MPERSTKKRQQGVEHKTRVRHRTDRGEKRWLALILSIVHTAHLLITTTHRRRAAKEYQRLPTRTHVSMPQALAPIDCRTPCSTCNIHAHFFERATKRSQRTHMFGRIHGSNSSTRKPISTYRNTATIVHCSVIVARSLSLVVKSSAQFYFRFTNDTQTTRRIITASKSCISAQIFKERADECNDSPSPYVQARETRSVPRETYTFGKAVYTCRHKTASKCCSNSKYYKHMCLIRSLSFYIM